MEESISLLSILRKKIIRSHSEVIQGKYVISCSPEAIWQMNETELIEAISKRGNSIKHKSVWFYAPGFMHSKTSCYSSSPSQFPTISITGNNCSLKCRHCGGIVLNTMLPASNEQELYKLCEKLKKDGAQGCLISGGCSAKGGVPLERYVDVIGRIKRDLGLTVLVHTGIISPETALALKNSCVDTALIDIIGSDATIREVCNLEATVEDYSSSLKALADSGIPFAPHVIAGLHFGKLKGELRALKMIRQYSPAAIVVIAFMPIRGSRMQNIDPPSPLEVARVVLLARTMFPQTKLALGCMRPKGEHRIETDILAMKAGVDAIAFPSEEVARFAKDSGYDINISSLCCSQIYSNASNLE